MKLISWNTAHRLVRTKGQADALLERKPDVVALQEVIRASALQLKSFLADGGLRHIVVSEPGGDSPRRSYCVLFASRFPLDANIPQLAVPWSEKSLSVLLDYRGQAVEFHNVHIPPGSSNGWIKVESLEAIFRALAVDGSRRRVLCGDFNTPQLETATGQTITWAQDLEADGQVRTLKRLRGGSGERWDSAERDILLKLSQFDLSDVFRMLHGYSSEAYSWVLHRKGANIRRRFDHVFASRTLNATSCQYLHAFREAGLSDHAAIEVEFEPAD